MNAGRHNLAAAMLLQPDGLLLAGGPFTQFGSGGGGLVRLFCEPPVFFGRPTLRAGELTMPLFTTPGANVRIESSTDFIAWKSVASLTNSPGNAVLPNQLSGMPKVFYRALRPAN